MPRWQAYLGDTTIGTAALNNYVGDANATADSQSASPDWRINRSLLTANGAEGTPLIAFQNVNVDTFDYFSGPLYKALTIYNETISPIRPFIDFLTNPLPGTSWMPSPARFIGNLLGAKFALFTQLLRVIDNMIGPLAQLAAESSSTDSWEHPQASLGGSSVLGKDKPIYLLSPLTVDQGILNFSNQSNVQAFNQYKATQGLWQT